jgi:VanZ family protein
MNVSRFLKYWLPLLIWLGVIFIGSSDLMSAEHTSRIIAPLLHWLKPDILPETIVQVQFVVRKCAHVSEYAILALVFWRALRGGTGLRMKMSILCLTVWMGATLVAAADEYHQSFVPSRGSSPKDVLIDSAGGIFGLFLANLLRRKKSEI